MTLKESLKWLVDNGYCVVVHNQVVFTKKTQQELAGSGLKAVIQEIETPADVIKQLAAGDSKLVWNKFIEDAGIPHRVKAPDGGVYTVRQYSASNAKRLVSIINDPAVDYQRLVDSTKSYYDTVSYKALLSNYFEKGLWRHEYDEWKGKKPINMGSGGNRIED